MENSVLLWVARRSGPREARSISETVEPRAGSVASVYGWQVVSL